jgi:hypothetical protein
MFIPNLQPAILPPNAQGSAAILMQPLVEDDVIITIERALVKVGTITFPKDGVNGVFSVATSTVFALGDALSLLCPNEIPDSFQNIGINLRLTLLG